MRTPKKRSATILILSALTILSGCAHQPELRQPRLRGATMIHRQAPTAPSRAPRPPMKWISAGSYRPADRTAGDVTAIVIHTTEGHYDDQKSFAENQADNFRNTIRYFENNDRSVSAHYVIGPNGEICQMVKETDVAHTQTYYNGRAFGIECAGWSDRPETWTPEMMQALVDLTAYLCDKWDIPAHHPAGTAYEGPYRKAEPDGAQHYTGKGLVGHYQVQPWNKTDPGPFFPWREFTKRVRQKL